MELTENTLSENRIYDGKVIKVYCDEVLLPDGRKSRREYVRHSGGVGVLAVSDGCFLMVRQYRYAYREAVLEIPAGKIEQGELPEECAARELKEEVGATAESFAEAGVFYPSPGYTNEKLYVYIAEGLTAGGNCPDDGEFLDVVKVPVGQAKAMIDRGEIRDAKTVIAIQRYLLDRIK